MSQTKTNFDSRREAFLDTADELFIELGYENTSIERLISRLGVSKGAFYHYFRSKSDLLDAAIYRLLSRYEAKFAEIVESDSPATKKLQSFVNSIFSAKTADRELATQIGDLLLNEANAVLMSRHRYAASQLFVPIFEKIIVQGVKEGEFNVESPSRVARIIWDIGQSWDENAYRVLFKTEEAMPELNTLLKLNNSYTLAIERVLGAKEGCLCLDSKLLEPWIETAHLHRAKNKPNSYAMEKTKALN
jgi:AcrR family transcriptional regulator